MILLIIIVAIYTIITQCYIFFISEASTRVLIKVCCCYWYVGEVAGVNVLSKYTFCFNSEVSRSYIV